MSYFSNNYSLSHVFIGVKLTSCPCTMSIWLNQLLNEKRIELSSALDHFQPIFSGSKQVSTSNWPAIGHQTPFSLKCFNLCGEGVNYSPFHVEWFIWLNRYDTMMYDDFNLVFILFFILMLRLSHSMIENAPFELVKDVCN